jgi:aerobic carbon-monoxide dehydrogenase medium subunit
VKPAPFEYVRPGSLEEALAVLGEHGDDAKVLAGGQSLVPLMNLRLTRPELIVDINGLGDLAYIQPRDGGLAIGALTRQRTIETSALVRERAPLLSQATPLIGHVPIRTRGTLGGSLSHADPAAEYPAVAVALEARLTLARRGGQRALEAEAFFKTYLTTALEPTEILIEVEVPALPPRSATAFLELTRRHGDFAIAGAAAVVTLAANGAIASARIALCGVGPTPLRARRAESILAGQRPTRSLLAEMAHAAAAACDPADDLHGSAEYRREMSGAFARRALEGALQKLGVAV